MALDNTFSAVSHRSSVSCHLYFFFSLRDKDFMVSPLLLFSCEVIPVCHSLIQWTMFCQNSSLWPTHLGWPCTAHSLIELHKPFLNHEFVILEGVHLYVGSLLQILFRRRVFIFYHIKAVSFLVLWVLFINDILSIY